MEWSDDHDVMLCREILCKYEGSPDRVEVWSEIARSLDSCTELKFNVKQRSVRDGVALLQAQYKETNRKDKTGSGTSKQM